MVDDKTRSVIKGLTWRAIATSDTIFLSWIFTGSITAAISIGLLELVTKTFLYYLHERLWVRIVRTWRKKGVRKVFKRTSVGKALTWRLIASLDTTFLAFIVTGDMVVAASIGAMEIFTKLFFYYIHERFWSGISWGRRKMQ